jgi:hypothetical protein
MKSIRRQFAEYKKSYVFYIPILLIFLLVALLCQLKNLDPRLFFKDPAAVSQLSAYVGSVSYVGVMMWCAVAVMCLFSASLMEGWRDNSRLFIIASGLISLFLMVDDLFMFHETLAPKYLGVSEGVVLAFYLVMMLVYLVFFRKIIINSSFLMLLIAAVFFGISIVLDLGIGILHDGVSGAFEKFILQNDMFIDTLEDALKVLGLTSWFIYYFHICRNALVRQRTN